MIEPFKDDMDTNKLKKFFSDSSKTNPHIPNLINIAQRLVEVSKPNCVQGDLNSGG